MSHSGKTMTFATDLLPQEDNIYNLGNSSQRWKIYGNVQPYTTRIYPVLGTTGERSAWYKITFPYHNATTGSAAKWFMNSFDLHFGGGYNSNPSGVAHISFYWTRAANNGAWTLGQGAAHIEGILANKIIFYYRVAEPGVLYVCNSANVYNGIWLDNLYVDDTSPSLDWSTTKIETTSAITANTNPALSAYTVLSTTYLYNDGGTLKTDSNFEGKYIKGTWLYTSAATAKTSTTKLATIESDNFIYYITPANALKSAIGTTAIGAEKTPIYWNGSSFAAGTALKALAYKDSLSASDVGAAPAVTGGYLPLSGGTLTGALTTANNTWNTIGDDAYLGDINKAGHIGIQGKNGNTGIFFTTYNQTTKSTGGAITWDGSKFSITSTTAVDASISGNAATATTATNLSAAPTIASGGTATVTLSANTAYTLTVGGKSVIFKTPADNNTATATDNILDGSNSGTAITYAPYTAQQAKLSFDTSTTAPTRTDRLNLNGFLYATKYNVAGHVTLQWNSTDSSLDFIFT